jgi:nicotinate (nicotinamide) nucleotide adenylyltransferase
VTNQPNNPPSNLPTTKSSLNLSEEALFKREQIGVLGGAFDPPHLAHLKLAQTAIEQLGLDRLIVVPTGRTFLKSHRLSTPVHRLEMASLTFKDLKEVTIDDCELKRAGVSYTLDTLVYLKNKYPDADFYLVVGADQARAFDTWHRWQEILHIATLAVAGRQLQSAGDEGEVNKTESLDKVHALLGREGLKEGYPRAQPIEMGQYKWHNRDLVQSVKAHRAWGDALVAVKLNMPSMSLSATEIRNLIKEGSDVSVYVTPSVLSYLHRHSLYTLKTFSND